MKPRLKSLVGNQAVLITHQTSSIPPVKPGGGSSIKRLWGCDTLWLFSVVRQSIKGEILFSGFRDLFQWRMPVSCQPDMCSWVGSVLQLKQQVSTLKKAFRRNFCLHCSSTQPLRCVLYHLHHGIHNAYMRLMLMLHISRGHAGVSTASQTIRRKLSEPSRSSKEWQWPGKNPHVGRKLG